MTTGYHRLLRTAVLILVSSGNHLQADEPPNPEIYFGKKQKSGAALIGMFYDFKQNSKGEPVPRVKVTEVVGQFLRQGWDEGVLRDYRCVTTPLYATQVFMPFMDAGYAPAAFGVEKTVQPRNWMIHYKGQVSSPKSGRFRFFGGSDDFMAVAINQKTALIANHPQIRFKDPGWDRGVREDPWVPNGRSVKGDWFEVKGGEIMDIDIIAGEIPGGKFGAWLFIEEDGVTYEKVKGQMIPTIFQVAPRTFEMKGDLPKFTDMKDPWVCHD